MLKVLKTDVSHPFAAALMPRAAVRPALRQGSAFLAGFLGGWAVLYGALMPFGLGLTLGFAEDCFAAGAAGALLGLLLHGFGALSLDSLAGGVGAGREEVFYLAAAFLFGIVTGLTALLLGEHAGKCVSGRLPFRPSQVGGGLLLVLAVLKLLC